MGEKEEGTIQYVEEAIASCGERCSADGDGRVRGQRSGTDRDACVDIDDALLREVHHWEAAGPLLTQVVTALRDGDEALSQERAWQGDEEIQAAVEACRELLEAAKELLEALSRREAADLDASCARLSGMVCWPESTEDMRGQVAERDAGP